MRDIAFAGLGISGNPVFLYGFLAYPPINKVLGGSTQRKAKGGWAPDFPFLFEKNSQ